MTRLDRRTLLRGGLGLGAATVLGSALAGCGSDAADPAAHGRRPSVDELSREVGLAADEVRAALAFARVMAR